MSLLIFYFTLWRASSGESNIIQISIFSPLTYLKSTFLCSFLENLKDFEVQKDSLCPNLMQLGQFCHLHYSYIYSYWKEMQWYLVMQKVLPPLHCLVKCKFDYFNPFTYDLNNLHSVHIPFHLMQDALTCTLVPKQTIVSRLPFKQFFSAPVIQQLLLLKLSEKPSEFNLHFLAFPV